MGRLVTRRARVLPVLGCAMALAGCAGVASVSSSQILDVVPGSIHAGFSIEIRATCGDNVNPAFVHSGAFGPVTLVPDHGLLATDVTIPPDTAAGAYPVTLTCASGQQSTVNLTVANRARPGRDPAARTGAGARPNPSVGPATGGGGTSAGAGVRQLVGGAVMVVIGAIIWIVAVVWRRVG